MTYDELSASGQQAVDMWADQRIAYADIPPDARVYLDALDARG